MSSATFKQQDAASYDPLTAEFHRFTERLSRPLARQVVALARLAPGQRVLDIGTGTGVVASEAVETGAQVLGIDLSEGMLAYARKNTGDRARFQLMDAEALELPDRQFDAVISLFALLHFPHPLTALQEMYRVLQPGGRLVVAVGSGPPLLSFSGLAHRLSRAPELLLRLQGRQLTAPGFLNGLLARFGDDAEPEESALARQGTNRSRSVPALVRQAGFSEVRTSWEGHLAVVDTPEEFWEMQRTFSSIARKRLARLSPEQATGIRDEFLATCQRVQARGGRLLYPYAALLVDARRPAA